VKSGRLILNVLLAFIAVSLLICLWDPLGLAGKVWWLLWLKDT